MKSCLKFSPANKPEIVCDELVNLAIQRRERSNITVIVAYLHRENLLYHLLNIFRIDKEVDDDKDHPQV